MDIKQLRKAAGYTQQALANATGMKLRQIQKYESGEYALENMTAKNFIALADALNIEPRELLK